MDMPIKQGRRARPAGHMGPMPPPPKMEKALKPIADTLGMPFEEIGRRLGSGSSLSDRDDRGLPPDQARGGDHRGPQGGRAPGHDPRLWTWPTWSPRMPARPRAWTM